MSAGGGTPPSVLGCGPGSGRRSDVRRGRGRRRGRRGRRSRCRRSRGSCGCRRRGRRSRCRRGRSCRCRRGRGRCGGLREQTHDDLRAAPIDDQLPRDVPRQVHLERALLAGAEIHDDRVRGQLLSVPVELRALGLRAHQDASDAGGAHCLGARARLGGARWRGRGCGRGRLQRERGRERLGNRRRRSRDDGRLCRRMRGGSLRRRARRDVALRLALSPREDQQHDGERCSRERENQRAVALPRGRGGRRTRDLARAVTLRLGRRLGRAGLRRAFALAVTLVRRLRRAVRRLLRRGRRRALAGPYFLEQLSRCRELGRSVIACRRRRRRRRWR